MSVYNAVLKELHALDVDPTTNALAASALALASSMDDPGTSATATSMCGKTLIDTITAIKAAIEQPEEDDAITAIRKRREAKRLRSAGAQAQLRAGLQVVPGTGSD